MKQKISSNTHVFNRAWFFGISRKAITASAILSALALAGCAGVPLSSTRFSGSSNLAVQTVQTGTVIRTMPIQINNSARVDQATGLGAGAGGIAGGIGGALMGSPIIGAIAGALGGGVIGDAITPGSGVGTDVFVKLNTGQTLSIPEAGVVHLVPGEHVYVMRGGKGHYRVEPANQPVPQAVSPANPAVAVKLSRLAATPAPAPAPVAPQRAKP